MRKTFCCLFIVLFFVGCSSQKADDAKQKYNETRLLMGTVVQVDACYLPGEEIKVAEAYKLMWDRLGDISLRMSAYNPESDLSLLSKSYQNPIGFSDDFYKLLSDSVAYTEKSGGAFDITVRPLIDLWKKAGQLGTLPDNDAINKTKEAVGVHLIKFSEQNKIEVLNPNTRVDLGGIAKGYAVDEAARILRDNGIGNFLVDAGGDVYVGGLNCENSLWRIGIRNPRDKSKVVDVVQLTNAAVTTSGDYEQFYEVNGERWSHIVNPVTGYPPKGGIVSASVIAPTAAEADAYSTALSVLSIKKGIDLIDSLGKEYSGYLVSYKDGKVIPSKTMNYEAFRSHRH